MAERDLLFTAVVLMLIVIIPVFVMAFLLAWRYRSSNAEARYTPDWSYSAWVNSVIWLVPALIVVSLGFLLWSNTHKLDPYKRIESTVPPLEIEVVALSKPVTLIIIGVAAVIQVVVHLRCFLRLDLTSTPRENLLAILFAAILIFIMVGGSFWIMFDLHRRMAM